MQTLEIVTPRQRPGPRGPVYEEIRALLSSQEPAGPLTRWARAGRSARLGLERRVVDVGVLLGTRRALRAACALTLLFVALSVYLISHRLLQPRHLPEPAGPHG
jgi:hypothetical protein